VAQDRENTFTTYAAILYETASRDTIERDGAKGSGIKETRQSGIIFETPMDLLEHNRRSSKTRAATRLKLSRVKFTESHLARDNEQPSPHLRERSAR